MVIERYLKVGKSGREETRKEEQAMHERGRKIGSTGIWSREVEEKSENEKKGLCVMTMKKGSRSRADTVTLER